MKSPKLLFRYLKARHALAFVHAPAHGFLDQNVLSVGRGCDGFVIAATYVPGSYADFVRHIVPELQRRGLFHKDYAGKTLRENLGLPRPTAGAWKSQPRVAAE